MAASTGPLLAIGAITMVNDVIFHSRPVDWRVPIAVGGACVVFAFLERPLGPAAAALAWTALVTSLIVPVRDDTQSPVVAAVTYFGFGKG